MKRIVRQSNEESHMTYRSDKSKLMKQYLRFLHERPRLKAKREVTPPTSFLLNPPLT